MGRLIKNNKFLIVALAFFIILRLPSLFEPAWYGDEGIYLVLGQAIRRGLTLYSQIHDNKPPTLYYLAALSQTVFGFRLLLLLWMLPTLYVFYRLAARFVTGWALKIAFFFFLIVSSLPFVEGTIANAEVFMLLPTIAAFLLFLRHKNYFIVGLLLGFAFTIKVPVAVEFAFLCFWLLITEFNLKKIFLLSLGFSLPIVLYGFYFALQGALLPFLNAALLQNFGYLSSWATGSHSASATSGGLMTRALVLLLAWIGAGYLVIKKKLDRQLIFLLGWFTATLFAVLLSGRPYPHYLVQLLPPLSILIASLFTRHHSKVILVAALGIFIAIVIRYQFYFYPIIPYYLNSYAYLFQLKTAAAYRSFFGSQVNSNNDLSDFIRQNSSLQDQIFVWGDQPFIYLLSDRLPLGRFTVAYHIVDFSAQAETMDKLEARMPIFIVTYPMAGRDFPAFDTFVDKYYYLYRSFGDSQLYRRR